MSLEDMRWQPQSHVERWCNNVASEFLVPEVDLQERFSAVAGLSLIDQLERLARDYRCGTLVVLQALSRTGLRQFDDYQATYDDEVERLKALSADRGDDGSSGQFLFNQPYRIGERLSRALITDALSGRTPLSEAVRLMSLKSLTNFDNYARYLSRADT